MMSATLALFDLDHTLLTGDSDALWCEYLMQHGLLDRAEFGPRNVQMLQRYADASVSVEEFCGFYVSTLAGRTPAECSAWCQRFLDEVVVPRISAAARELVETHRRRGERLVLTTATNRVITELTAQHLGIADLIATEVELVDGHYTGRTRGVLNMREGKVARLHSWLDSQAMLRELLASATLYSDSSNDLPLLGAVGHPIVVDPDATLRDHALAHAWPIVELAR